MKRARADPLTGGSGDVNPNVFWWDVAFPMDKPGEQQNQGINIPVQPNIGQSKDLVTVAEILKVSWKIFGSEEFANDATSSSFRVNERLNMGGPQNPGSAAYTTVPLQGCLLDFQLLGSTTATRKGGSAVGPGIVANENYSSELNIPITGYVDCTDADGHGILLYGNNLSASCVSSGAFTSFKSFTIRYCIMYRVKYVTLQDYIVGLNQFPSQTGVSSS